MGVANQETLAPPTPALPHEWEGENYGIQRFASGWTEGKPR